MILYSDTDIDAIDTRSCIYIEPVPNGIEVSPPVWKFQSIPVGARVAAVNIGDPEPSFVGIRNVTSLELNLTIRNIDRKVPTYAKMYLPSNSKKS